MKADALHRMIVSGGEWPSSGTERARQQHLLRTRNALAVARAFQEAGILPLVDEVLNLPEHLDMVRAERDPMVIGLRADPAVVLARDEGRQKHTASLYLGAEADIDRVLGKNIDWIQTDELSLEAVVALVVDRIASC